MLSMSSSHAYSYSEGSEDGRGVGVRGGGEGGCFVRFFVALIVIPKGIGVVRVRRLAMLYREQFYAVLEGS